MNSLRALEELRATRARRPWKFPGPATFRLRVSGLLFERWLAKVVLGSRAFFSEALASWKPPTWLAKVAFGLEHLPKGAGLAGLARVGDTITNAEQVQLAFVHRLKDTGPSAVLFSARGGFRFFFSWEVPIESFDGVNVHGVLYAAQNSLMAKPKGINFADGVQPLNISLDFDWSDKPKPDPEVVRLREKYPSPARSRRAKRRRDRLSNRPS